MTINVQRENNGIVPIYCSLSSDKGRPLIFSTGLKITKTKWDSAAQKAKGGGEESLFINRDLMNIRMKLTEIYNELANSRKTISNKLIKSIFSGEEKTQKSFGNLVEASIGESIRDFENGKIAKGTLKIHKTYHTHLMMFLLYKKVEDISLREIDYAFLKEFQNWGANYEGSFFKTISKEHKDKLESWGLVLHTRNNAKVKWCVNYLAKHLSLIKEIFDEGVKLGEVSSQNNPFNNFTIEHENDSEFKYLTVEELNTIEKMTFDSDKLSRVRDCFVFSCYTGLAYIDTRTLSKDWLSKDIKGNTIIRNNRQKTNVGFTIPVLKPALDILDKYKDDPQCLYNERLLPVLSNAKYNTYLKEIGAICGIKKNITTHVARHTAATLLLRYGVPAESVCKVLGLGLQVLLNVYGDIVQDKIIEDMNVVDRRILKSM